MDDVDRMVGEIIREKRRLLKGNIERFAQAPLNRCFSFKKPYFKGFLSISSSGQQWYQSTSFLTHFCHI